MSVFSTNTTVDQLQEEEDGAELERDDIHINEVVSR